MTTVYSGALYINIHYLLSLAGLGVILSILGLSQEVREHQGFERAGARRPGVAERVHHSEVSSVAHGAE